MSDEIAVQGVPPAEALDRIQGKLVPLGQRFHGSDSSFPLSLYTIFYQPDNNLMICHDRGTRSSFGRVPVSACRRCTAGLGGPSLG